jgi:predicted acylesterase/phospholipase RssA
LVIAVFLEAANNRKPTSVVDVIGLSFAILQRHADLEWRRAADVTIEPVVKDFLWDDFERTSELIAAGEAAARAALPKIRAAIEEKIALKKPALESKDIAKRLMKKRQ